MPFDPSKLTAFLLRHLPAVCFGAALLLFLVFGGLLLRQALGGGQPQPPSLPASSASFPASSAASADPWALNEEGILNAYAPYYEQNPDMIGWLSIEGTVIDYPVVRTPGDNEKYLRLGFDGAYATGGTLFLDERCDPGVEKVTANQMIYGHDMHDGTMFGKPARTTAKSTPSSASTPCMRWGNTSFWPPFTPRSTTPPTPASSTISSSTRKTKRNSTIMWRT